MSKITKSCQDKTILRIDSFTYFEEMSIHAENREAKIWGHDNLPGKY